MEPKLLSLQQTRQVEMDRFDGKPLINRPVADGIRKTEELINRSSFRRC